MTHYVRSLGPTDQYTDPADVVEQARFEAEEGVCDESVKSSIDQKMAFKGPEQVEQAKAVYASNCSSCHGAEGKGDGAAAAALDPKPRNFHSADAEWTNGTSPLAIFDTLANGIEGTSMAAFAHLPEEDRWAMVHLIREEWLPAGQKEEASEEEVLAVCRSLSAGGEGEAIPIASAIRFLSEDIREQRAVRFAEYGATWVHDAAQAAQGEAMFEQHCQACHGPKGMGAQLGPYGSQPPYLFVQVGKLEPASAGGTFIDFARRAMKGAHVSLPDMTGASHLSGSDWMALQAYVATFDGQGTVKPMSERPVEQTAGEETAEGEEGATAPADEDAEQPAALETTESGSAPAEGSANEDTEGQNAGEQPANEPSEETPSGEE